MIFIVCILALMAAMLTVFDTSTVIFVCCAVGSVCGMWMLYAVLARSSRLRLTWVLASALLIGYCFGAFVTEVGALLAGQDAMTYLGLDRGWAAYALVLVMLASITLLLAGWVETPIVQDRHIVQISWRQERFLWIAVTVVVAAYFHGSVSYGGDINNGGTVSIFGDIIFTLVPLLPAMASIGVAQASGRRRLRFLVLAVVAFLAVLPFGRRQLLYALVISFIGVARLSGRTWRLSTRRKILLIAASVIVLVVSSFVFFALRLATGSISEGRHSIASILEAAERTTFKDPRLVAAQLGANVEERTAFLIRYLAWLGRGGDTPSPLYGQDAALAIHMATPNALFRAAGLNKQQARSVATEEVLANEHFGLTDTDDANSVLTGGIIDFGVAGVIAYPLIFCALARLALFLAGEVINREGRILAVFAVLFLYLQTEAPIAVYLIGLRNLGILLFCWAFLYWLPAIRGKAHPVRALSSRWAEH
jgi:hypothetical protein